MLQYTMASSPSIIALDRAHLSTLMHNEIQTHGFHCDLNHIDVSRITDFSNLFRWEAFNKFNGDISQWDTSKVETMESMFKGSRFTGDISQWNTGRVNDMFSMFADARFNGDLSNWDVANVKEMRGMFLESRFRGDISRWNTERVTCMANMFEKSTFLGDLS